MKSTRVGLLGLAMLVFGVLMSSSARSEDIGGWDLTDDAEKINKAYAEQKKFQEQEAERIRNIYLQGLAAQERKEAGQLTDAAQTYGAAGLEAQRQAAEANALRKRAQAEAERAASRPRSCSART